MIALFLAVLASGTCGTERWAIKVGSDPAAATIHGQPHLATVSSLNALEPECPSGEIQDAERLPDELQLFQVEGTVVALPIHKGNKPFNREKDRDFHIVITDGAKTMVVEVPDPNCAAGSAFLEQLKAVRHRASRLKPGQRVRITGPLFHDFYHRQAGHADVHTCGTQQLVSEIHPILSLEVIR